MGGAEMVSAMRITMPYASFCILWRRAKGGKVEIFLIQEENEHEQAKWKCVGGKGELTKDGGDPKRTATREIMEEVQVHARQKELIGMRRSVVVSEKGNDHILFFFARETAEDPRPNPQEGVVRGAWLSEKALLRLDNATRLVHRDPIIRFLERTRS